MNQEEKDNSPFFHDILKCGRIVETTRAKSDFGERGSGKSYCLLHDVVIWSKCGWEVGMHNAEDSRALIEDEIFTN